MTMPAESELLSVKAEFSQNYILVLIFCAALRLCTKFGGSTEPEQNSLNSDV